MRRKETLLMAKNVAQFMLERLHGWGVRRIFAYPGDGINSFLGAFNDIQGTEHEIEFTQTRHEEIATFAASAHAKFTGEVGMCMATSGGGANHLLNALYDAKLDHQPVVAIVGQQKRMSTNFAEDNDLSAASLTALGAFSAATLGYFDMERKEYDKTPVEQQVEVLSLLGTIAPKEDNEAQMHAHVVLGRSDGTRSGGHLLEAHVRPTLEVIVTESPEHLQRRTDEETGSPW